MAGSVDNVFSLSETLIRIHNIHAPYSVTKCVFRTVFAWRSLHADIVDRATPLTVDNPHSVTFQESTKTRITRHNIHARTTSPTGRPRYSHAVTKTNYQANRMNLQTTAMWHTNYWNLREATRRRFELVRTYARTHKMSYKVTRKCHAVLCQLFNYHNAVTALGHFWSRPTFEPIHVTNE